MSAVSSQALRDWLAAATGGEVLAWRRLVSGNSRTTFAADVRLPAQELALVVRHDEGGGPVAGTELSLEREAVAYRALEGSDLPVPRLYGQSADLKAIAVTRMPGSTDEPARALPDLLARLAQLHRLPVAELELPGFARRAAADLDLWNSIATQKLAEPDGLVAFAVEVLSDLFPGEPARLVFCHGDAGEGNFLAQGERVSGLLDWEFAHLGDPHDDLAWVTVRALMFGHQIPDFGRLVRAHYADAAGVTLSAERLRYWQAVVVLRNVICCLSAANEPEHNRDRFVHLMLLPGLRAPANAPVGAAVPGPARSAGSAPRRDRPAGGSAVGAGGGRPRRACRCDPRSGAAAAGQADAPAAESLRAELVGRTGGRRDQCRGTRQLRIRPSIPAAVPGARS